jgi:hypothetical protein
MVALEPGERLDSRVSIHLSLDSDHADWIWEVAEKRGVDRCEVVRALVCTVMMSNTFRYSQFMTKSRPPGLACFCL